MSSISVTEPKLSKDELDVLRTTIYFIKTKMPHSISWSQTVAGLEVEPMARRIGLIPFKTDKDVHQVTISNDTSEPRLIRAGQLDCQGLTCYCPDQIVTPMPPGKIDLRIVFDERRGLDNAKYDLTTKVITPEVIKVEHPYLDSEQLIERIENAVLDQIGKIE